MNLLLIVAYAVAGFATDFLITKYYLCLSKHRRAGASGLAVLIDLWQYLVAMTLILDRNIPGAIGFALGTGLGTWVAMGKNKDVENRPTPHNQFPGPDVG